MMQIINEFHHPTPVGAARYHDAYINCMSDAGLNIPASAMVDGPEVSNGYIGTYLDERPREFVAKFGYATRDPAENAIAGQDDAFDAWFESLSASKQDRFSAADEGPPDSVLTVENESMSMGIPSGGCNYVGLQRQWGDVERYLTLLNDANSVRGDILNRIYESDTYREAVNRWRSCVESAGYTATDDPGEMPAAEDEANALSVALVDYDCAVAEISDARRAAEVEAATAMEAQLMSLVDSINDFQAELLAMGE